MAVRAGDDPRANAQVLQGVLEEGGEVVEGAPRARFVEEEVPAFGVAEEAMVEGEGDGEEADIGRLPEQVGEEAFFLWWCVDVQLN